MSSAFVPLSTRPAKRDSAPGAAPFHETSPLRSKPPHTVLPTVAVPILDPYPSGFLTSHTHDTASLTVVDGALEVPSPPTEAPQHDIRASNKFLRRWQGHPCLFLSNQGFPMDLNGFLSIFDEVNEIHPFCDARFDDEGIYIKFDHDHGVMFSEELACKFMDRWHGKEVEGFEYELSFQYFLPVSHAINGSEWVHTSFPARKDILETSSGAAIPRRQERIPESGVVAAEPTAQVHAAAKGHEDLRLGFRNTDRFLARYKKTYVLFLSSQYLPVTLPHRKLVRLAFTSIDTKVRVSVNDDGFFGVFSSTTEDAEEKIQVFMNEWNGKRMFGADIYPLFFEYFEPVL